MKKKTDGTLNGNLYLRGVGDPSMSNRFWKGDTPMAALARQIAQAGIKHVRGNIIGDASAFDGQLIPDGWKRSYLGAAYAARVSFFFQAEDGIRDKLVTGVQTCALPISTSASAPSPPAPPRPSRSK